MMRRRSDEKKMKNRTEVMAVGVVVKSFLSYS
jgi:hypothetical protein